jgi:HPt (histidine-containing phosphotransfer) domain-containing protein
LRVALADNDLTHAAAIAHSEISTAGAIGAEGLAATARSLDLAVARGAMNELPALVDEFEQHHGQALSDIDRYLTNAQRRLTTD